MCSMRLEAGIHIEKETIKPVKLLTHKSHCTVFCMGVSLEVCNIRVSKNNN